MIVFPNAKINLGLFVTSRRYDGYHNLETVFVPVKGFHDVLEVQINTETTGDNLVNSGLQVTGCPTGNLCLKAVLILRQHARIPGLDIHLHKAIPFGAGLGGGSADAAFMLMLLNDKFDLGFDKEALESMASRIGADCPFFVRNKTVLASGTGNIFSPVTVNLDGVHVMVVVPPVQVPTALAYKKISPREPAIPLAELVQQPMEDWKGNIINDFEIPVFLEYPLIEQVKTKLYHEGAFYASMSGSGSSVYGLFYKKPSVKWGEGYTVFTGII